MDKAWMESPEGEVREVAADELTPFIVKGWRQCAPPGQTGVNQATAPQIDGEQEDMNDASESE